MNQSNAGRRNRLLTTLVVGLTIASLTCADDPAEGDANDTVIDGYVVVGGPVAGAEVIVYQIVSATGQRGEVLGRTRTEGTGFYSANLAATVNSVEIEVTGGRYTDAVSDRAVERGPAVLRGLALDLRIGEKRHFVNVTPWSHLIHALGESRARPVADGGDGGRLEAMHHARDLITAHLGADPTTTEIANLGEPVPSATPEFKLAASLAGLATMSWIANDDGFADVTTQTVLDVLTVDVAGDSLFDGDDDSLALTAICPPPPPPCMARGAGCYNSCALSSHALRAHLANGIRVYLRTHRASGQTAATVATWLEELRTADEPLLFPPGEPEELDTRGPRIVWSQPASDGIAVRDTVSLVVVADDPIDVASLTVALDARPVTDSDPSPSRFEGTLDTRAPALAEGVATLVATATDTDGRRSTAPRTIAIDNIDGGTLSGVVTVSGPVVNATVRAYALVDGMPDAVLVTDTTNGSGVFMNLEIPDGYDGPILLEAGGGGTYREGAARANTLPVALDQDDLLYTIVNYSDGAALTDIVVSPMSSFATSYFRYLRSQAPSGTDDAATWAVAIAAMEAHFDTNLRTVVPLAPEQMTTLTSGARAGLVLLGLSQTAWRVSTDGGGDGGSYGLAMHTLRVTRVLVEDIADGCWDGVDDPVGAQLLYGGTQAVGVRAARRDLATAIVEFLDDPILNTTEFVGAVDVLPLLDTLSAGGPNLADGECANGRINPDAGGIYDQVLPTITITPDDGAVVGGVVMADAFAEDNIDMRPSLRFTAPMGTADIDGDPTDMDAVGNINTNAFVPGEGTLMVSLESYDDSNPMPGTKTVTWIVDNAPPVVTIDGVSDGAWYAGTVTPTVTATDSHLQSLVLMLDGLPFTSGTPVASEGRHVLVATAVDTVGNPTTRTVTFYIDLMAPTLAVTSAVLPTWIRGTVEVTVTADDTMRTFGSLTSDIVVTATGPSGAVALSPTFPDPGGGGRQARVQIDTTVTGLGNGSLSVTFAITDRAGRVATPITVTRTMDNVPPAVMINTVRNQSGAMPDDWVSELAASITGAVTPGGSPTSIALTLTPAVGMPVSVTVTPNPMGAWSYTTPSVWPAGSTTVVAIATDEAGNLPGNDSHSFRVDRTGPAVTFETSNMLDEATRCTVAINANTTDGAMPAGNPVTYTCTGTPTDLSPGGVTIAKYVARLASTASNPIRWNINASDPVGGIGVAEASDTVRFRVYRTTAGPSWVNATPGLLSGSTLPAAASVLAGDWPELLTHTSTFTIELQAKDQLGNWGPPVTRTWNHRPLALPVGLTFIANAPTSSIDDLYPYSIHRHSLFPSAAQVDPARAMSSPTIQSFEPRAMFVFNLVNPHQSAVNVGFFLPAIPGATQTRRVWDTAPWINAVSMTAPTNGSCAALNPWPSTSWSARINHNPPYNCNTGSCTCNSAGWNQPVDDLPSTAASTSPLTDNMLAVSVVDLSLPSSGSQLIPGVSLTPTVDGRIFHEFSIPAAPTATQGRVVRVLVGLPNMDFFAPYLTPADGVQESDGLGTEQHRTTGGYVATMTASFYERWGGCYATSGGNCTTARPRRHLRALVEGRIGVPVSAMTLNVRQRATNGLTATPEMMSHLRDNAGLLRNTAAFLWETCEAPGYAPYTGQNCVPNIATTTNSN